MSWLFGFIFCGSISSINDSLLTFALCGIHISLRLLCCWLVVVAITILVRLSLVLARVLISLVELTQKSPIECPLAHPFLQHLCLHSFAKYLSSWRTIRLHSRIPFACNLNARPAAS